MNSTDNRAHGNAAAEQAIEPGPRGRFGISAWTERVKPKPAPIAARPLAKRTPRVRLVTGMTVSAARRRTRYPRSG